MGNIILDGQADMEIYENRVDTLKINISSEICSNKWNWEILAEGL